MLKAVEFSDEKQRKEWAETLRGYADKVESGEIANSVFIANDTEDHVYFASADFRDRWQLLGAIEYAKIKAMDDG